MPCWCGRLPEALRGLRLSKWIGWTVFWELYSVLFCSVKRGAPTCCRCFSMHRPVADELDLHLSGLP